MCFDMLCSNFLFDSGYLTLNGFHGPLAGKYNLKYTATDLDSLTRSIHHVCSGLSLSPSSPCYPEFDE